MYFDDLEPGDRALTLDLLVRHGFDADFPLDLSPDDEMFFAAVLPGYPGRPGAAFYRYVESALRTFAVYEQLTQPLGGLASLGRVLDFGSGYGRLTRALSRRLPVDRIWVSDIYSKAVAWQRETFGVHGVDSCADPDDFTLDGPFDIVFAASVFSHLPDDLFRRWLERLHRLVAPGGLLAFSTHSPDLAPEGQAIGPDGFGFARWSESTTLDPGIYGMSYATTDYVRQAIAGVCGAETARGARVFPRALFENQDLYVVPGQGLDLSDLVLRAPPVGGFARLGAGRSGWALEPNVGAQIIRASLHIDGQLAATTIPSVDNHQIMHLFPGAPNVAVRWGFDEIRFDPGATLRVELESSTGLRAWCHAEGPSAQADDWRRV